MQNKILFHDFSWHHLNIYTIKSVYLIYFYRWTFFHKIHKNIMGRLARSAFETFAAPLCARVLLFVCVCSFNQETQPFTKLYQLKVFCCWSSFVLYPCIHSLKLSLDVNADFFRISFEFKWALKLLWAFCTCFKTAFCK